MSFFESVGNNIVEILEEKNMTQKQLADEIGISKQVMTKIVKGQKAINALEIKKIAEVLNVTVDRLVSEKEPEVKEPVLMFMGSLNDNNKEQFKFLSSVIEEIIRMEEVLDECQ